MRKCLLLLGVIVYAGFFGLSPAQAVPTQSFTDAWDISQGATIISNSPVYSGFAIHDMFGGKLLSGIEPGNTIFADGYPLGTVHYVGWQTLSLVTLSGCNLFAGHDVFNPVGQIRSFSRFVLQAQDASSIWQTLIDFSPTFPYNDGSLGNLAQSLAFPGGPVTAQYFQALFTQYDNGYAPRIYELDAVGAAAPLPGTLVLLGSGLVSLVALRRRFGI